jgi:signal transduction histidine kinase/ligand-binding sensor domain-containing protein
MAAMERGRRAAWRWWHGGLRAAVVGCVVAGLVPAAAQAASMLDPTGRFTIQWWTSDDGLPDTWVTGVALAADGTVFCCSRERLVRFDGLSFQVIPATLTEPLCEAIGNFWSLGFDGEGRLWVQGGRAVARLDAGQDPAHPTAWTVHRFATGKAFGLSFGPDGRPVIVGPDLLAAFDGRRVVQFLPGTDDDEECRWRYGGVSPGNGDIWLWGTRPGPRKLFRARLAPDASACVWLDEDDGPIGSSVISMTCGPSGIWALLPDGLAVHRGGVWEKVPPSFDDPEYRISGKIAESSDGTVWVSDHSGLLACRDGRIETAIAGVPGFSSFTSHLVADGTGGVWAACAGGLLAVRRSAVHVQPIEECRAVFVRRDGTVLVAGAGAVTAHDALASAPVATAQPAGKKTAQLVATLPKGVEPTSLVETADGRIWVGTQSSYILRIEDGAVRQITKPDRHFRELRSIQSLAIDVDNRVWAGTANGLAVHDPSSDEFRLIPGAETPLHAYVIGLAADADGGVLVATVGRGVMRVWPDGTEEQVVKAVDLPGRTSLALHRDSAGTLWVGGDRGLLGVSPAGAMLQHSAASGLAGDAVRQIGEDGQGRLWIATRDGHIQGMRLDSLDQLASGRIQVVRGIVLGPLDGLGGDECTGRILHATGGPAQRGPATPARIIVPLARGLAVLEPTRLDARPQVVAPPIITHDSREAWGFAFSSPGVPWGEPPCYQTFLRAVDTAWSIPAADTRREYATLPPGEHVFRARLVAGETDRDFPVSEIVFRVPTPFWRRPAVWAIGAVLLSLTSFVAAREATQRRARREVARLEELLEQQRAMDRERARIARDIHDSLGAGLTQVAFMSDLARRRAPLGEEMRSRLDTIYGRARRLTRSVDEIVWAVNPKNDTLDRFIAYVVNDVEEFARAGDLVLRLTVPDEPGGERAIPAGMRHHLCLAVREVIQNVLRHAHASRLEFTVTVTPAALVIEIGDDGVGFPAAQPRTPDQDGLDNIRARLADLGGSVVVDTRPGAGTRVMLCTPWPASGQAAARPRAELAIDIARVPAQPVLDTARRG